MRSSLFLLALNFFAYPVFSQYVYTIKADTVKITNCDSAELVLQNHTQGVPGFLFNAGNGRTVFQRGAQQLGNGMYLVGADTIRTTPNAWLQGGNTFGTTGVLGTLDNNHLDLYTNATQQVRLTNTGNLLLGTNSDSGDKLQVNGREFVNGGILIQNSGSLDASQNGLVISASGSSNYAAATYYNNVSGDLGQFFLTGSAYPLYSSILTECFGLYSNSPGGIVIVSENATSPVIRFSTGNLNEATERMRVSAAGNLLIGTTSDNGDNLQVAGTVSIAGLTSDSTQNRVLVADVNGNLYYRSATSLATADVIRSSLAVRGPISAQRLILCQQNWADYVFDSTYRLPSLATTEDYIRRQHHLPGIPSAAEVMEKGVDVGDNQAALLKKIEELTLYAVDQDKRLNEERETAAQQAKKIDIQNAKIEMLETKITCLTKLINNKIK